MTKRELKELLKFERELNEKNDKLIRELGCRKINEDLIIDRLIKKTMDGILTPNQFREIFGIKENNNDLKTSDYEYVITIDGCDVCIYQDGYKLKRIGKLKLESNIGEIPTMEILYI